MGGATRCVPAVAVVGWLTLLGASASGSRRIFKERTKNAPLPEAVTHTAKAMHAETQRGRSPSQSHALPIDGSASLSPM
jgi:hypothetical protein